MSTRGSSLCELMDGMGMGLGLGGGGGGGGGGVYVGGWCGRHSETGLLLLLLLLLLR